MKTRSILSLTLVAILGLTALALSAKPVPSPVEAPAANTQVARGEYLVKIMACNDCHTPFTMGPQGPEPDMTRMLSGHPQNMIVTPPAPLKEPWVMVGAGTNTAYAGPWGVSFTANLTPDPETGLGKWTEATLIKTLRTGRHEGQGRPILPPMPYAMYRQATDEDLRAIFAYLQSIPPIRNRVPQPIDPPENQ